MISVARKNLFSERMRFVISISGVVFSSLLIMAFLAIYIGIRNQIGLYVQKSPADVWVMSEGTSNIFYGTSNLPETMASSIERKIGKGSVHRLIVGISQVDTSKDLALLSKRQLEKRKKEEAGIRNTIIVVGFDPTSGAGGPWKLKAGTTNITRHQVIIDATLASLRHVGIGDTIQLQDQLFTVAGISEETNLMVLQMAFIPFRDAQEIFNLEGRTNYFLVSLDNPDDSQMVRDRINAEIPNISAKTRPEFVVSHIKLFDESDALYFIPVMVIGFLVGTVVVGLTIYAATTEKIREFGILKAIGASNKALYKIVLEQTLWIIIIGFLGGFLITAAILPIIRAFSGMYIPLSLFVIGITLVVCLVMGLLAAILPIRRVSRVDPIIVFKS